MKLPAGKVPPEILKEIIYKNLGIKRKEVKVGPSLGLDGAVIEIGGKSLVTSMDPITGALNRVGWLAVNVNANDVATFGVQPAFLSSCLLLPENTTDETVEAISKQVDRGAKELGIAVIGGHSEVTPSLVFPIVVGCCMGLTERGHYVTSQGAQASNTLIMTKSAGLEGSAILAADRRPQLTESIGGDVLDQAEEFFEHISVVKDAILAFQTGHVKAMHDPTEGGVAGGLHELADASNVGFRVYGDRIPIAVETLKVCEFFGIDPLQLTASGSLLIAAEKAYADEILKVLTKSGIAATIIGALLPSPQKRLVVRKDGKEQELTRPVSDHLWTALKT